MEDCEPCPEIDDVRYDQFFEQLGEEMRAKVAATKKLEGCSDQAASSVGTSPAPSAALATKPKFIKVVRCMHVSQFSE